MKQLILIITTTVLATGCLTSKLCDSIEKENHRSYTLNTLGDLKGGFNSKGDLVIHNFQKKDPKNFSISRPKGKYTYRFTPNENTIIDRSIPIFNINETTGEREEYLLITKKTNNTVTFSLKEKGKKARLINVYTHYKIPPNTSKRFGLKLLYPFAIIGDIAIVGALLYLQGIS